MALNRINADSIADGTVIASDIADNTITVAKITSGAFATLTANANSAFIQANAAFTQANTAASTGKAIAMSIVFG
jgi:hypothetical protein